MPRLRIKRGTRSQITAAASANQLLQGELYHVTDEGRVDLGTGTDSSVPLALLSDLQAALTPVAFHAVMPAVAGRGFALGPMVFPTTVTDTHGAFDSASGTFTVPVSGYYHLDLSLSLYVTSGTNSMYAGVLRNGVVIPDVLAIRLSSTLAWQSGSTHVIAHFDAGDVVNASITNATWSGTLVASSGSVGTFSGHRLPGL